MTEKTMNPKVKEAVLTILSELNGGNRKQIAETICDTVRTDHRTLQQLFWSAMLQAQIRYGDSATEAQRLGGHGFDLRNEDAVQLAIKVKALAVENNMDMGLRYI